MDNLDIEIMRELRKNFITGFLVLLPIFITLWVIWFFISKIITFSLILFPKEIPLLAKIFWSIFIIILSILVIAIIGLAARNVIGKKLIDFGEKFIRRIPVAKWIYETAKKISRTFFGKKLKIFKEVVLIEYPREGIYCVGFVTSKLKGGIAFKNEEPHISVFLPTAPNPTGGFLMVVPQKDIVPLDISVEEAMRFIISAGAILPKSEILKK